MKHVPLKKLLREVPLEYPHVRQVNKLAMSIFQVLQPFYSFDKLDGKILRAAAQLHDAGYASRPCNHVKAGVDLLRSVRLVEYTPVQQQYVTAVVSLHRRNYKAAMRTPEFKVLKKPSRALRLGAILRIADGLDHSHVQDARFLGIRMTPDAIEMQVAADWYPGNISWAQQKADLWAQVFGLPLKVIPVTEKGKKMRLGHVVSGDATILEALRALLYSQYRLVIDNLDGACRGEDSVYLHDLRVALRRMRAIMVFFKPVMQKMEMAEHLQFVRELTQRLGRGRDSQVWLDDLHAASARAAFARTEEWHAFVARETRKGARRNTNVAKILKDPACLASLRALAFFLRINLPGRIERQRRAQAFAAFAAARLGAQLDTLLAREQVTRQTSPEVSHEYRKVVRKTRYMAEFTEPVIPELHELTRCLKALADALGDVQDKHVQLDYVNALPAQDRPPAAFVRKIRRELGTAWRAYDKALASLLDPGMLRRVRRLLNLAGRPGAQ